MAAKQQTNIKNKLGKSSSKSSIRPSVSTSSLLEYFRAGESYTSLVLGIIVVIIASVLLLSLFKTRPDSQTDSQKGTTSISTVAKQSEEITPTPTLVQVGTLVKTNEQRDAGTKVNPDNRGTRTYTIMPGDDLWSIAVKTYGDGYRWTELAKANNLTDPGLIHVGNKLVVLSDNSTVISTLRPADTLIQPEVPGESSGQRITGDKYVIVAGDDLWDIAVRAYGDGYKWVEIARINNISEPNLIFSGNTLKIPR